MSNLPIVTANELRDYVRKQNVAPEAAPALALMQRAANQIDQLASASVKWADQSKELAELRATIAGYQEAEDTHQRLVRELDVALFEEMASADPTLDGILHTVREGGWKIVSQAEDSLDGADMVPDANLMQELVDNACLLFGIEEYRQFLPKLRDVQDLMTRQNEALMLRDRQLEELDGQVSEAKNFIERVTAIMRQPIDTDPAALLKVVGNYVTYSDAARDELAVMRRKEMDAKPANRSHQALADIVEVLEIEQVPPEELVQAVAALKESHRSAVGQRDELRARHNRIALALGIPDGSTQDLIDEINGLYGNDNTTTGVEMSEDPDWVGWKNEAVDLCHAVAGDLSPENRVMARAARQLIETAPRGEHNGD